MKINRLETHDRLLKFKQMNSLDISQCCQDLIDQRPFGEHSFYIFAHKRTIDENERMQLFLTGRYLEYQYVPTHTVVWQPRLTKPKAQTNSMLFKGYPGSDNIKVIWMIPERELWEQYKKDNLTENQSVVESIHHFEHNRAFLEKKDDDDLSDEEINAIYKQVSYGANYNKMMKRTYGI
jgi:hypothetical protein